MYLHTNPTGCYTDLIECYTRGNYTMASSMIRVSEELIDDLKLLKELHKAPSYQLVIKDLVHEALKTSHAFTKEGYLPAGCVVASHDGKPLVIKGVTDGKVIFNDNTYVINGGATCYSLNFLAGDRDWETG